MKRVSSKYAKSKRFPKLRITLSLLCIGPQTPVAAQATAWVCGRSFVGIAGRMPPGERMFVVSDVCYPVEVCDGLIPHPEKYYRVCVCVCVRARACVTECDQ